LSASARCEAGARLVEPAEVLQRAAEIAQRGDVVGVDRQRAPVSLDRLLHPALALQGDAEIGVDARDVGPQSQRVL